MAGRTKQPAIQAIKDGTEEAYQARYAAGLGQSLTTTTTTTAQQGVAEKDDEEDDKSIITDSEEEAKAGFFWKPNCDAPASSRKQRTEEYPVGEDDYSSNSSSSSDDDENSDDEDNEGDENGDDADCEAFMYGLKTNARRFLRAQAVPKDLRKRLLKIVSHEFQFGGDDFMQGENPRYLEYSTKFVPVCTRHQANKVSTESTGNKGIELRMQYHNRARASYCEYSVFFGWRSIRADKPGKFKRLCSMDLDETSHSYLHDIFMNRFGSQSFAMNDNWEALEQYKDEGLKNLGTFKYFRQQILGTSDEARTMWAGVRDFTLIGFMFVAAGMMHAPACLQLGHAYPTTSEEVDSMRNRMEAKTGRRRGQQPRKMWTTSWVEFALRETTQELRDQDEFYKRAPTLEKARFRWARKMLHALQYSYEAGLFEDDMSDLNKFFLLGDAGKYPDRGDDSDADQAGVASTDEERRTRYRTLCKTMVEQLHAKRRPWIIFDAAGEFIRSLAGSQRESPAISWAEFWGRFQEKEAHKASEKPKKGAKKKRKECDDDDSDEVSEDSEDESSSVGDNVQKKKKQTTAAAKTIKRSKTVSFDDDNDDGDQETEVSKKETRTTAGKRSSLRRQQSTTSTNRKMRRTSNSTKYVGGE